jgi:DNA-directed RNA polymerase subunit RPC12/RpoP
MGCHKEMRPLADKDTMVVYCTECGKPINNVSVFMKRQMLAYGQIRNINKKKLAWSVKCSHCSKEGPPELNKNDEQLTCSYCHKLLDNLSKPFAQMIRTNLQAQKRADE